MMHQRQRDQIKKQLFSPADWPSAKSKSLQVSQVLIYESSLTLTQRVANLKGDLSRSKPILPDGLQLSGVNREDVKDHRGGCVVLKLAAAAENHRALYVRNQTPAC